MCNQCPHFLLHRPVHSMYVVHVYSCVFVQTCICIQARTQRSRMYTRYHYISRTIKASKSSTCSSLRSFCVSICTFVLHVHDATACIQAPVYLFDGSHEVKRMHTAKTYVCMKNHAFEGIQMYFMCFDQCVFACACL